MLLPIILCIHCVINPTLSQMSDEHPIKTDENMKSLIAAYITQSPFDESKITFGGFFQYISTPLFIFKVAASSQFAPGDYLPDILSNKPWSSKGSTI